MPRCEGAEFFAGRKTHFREMETTPNKKRNANDLSSLEVGGSSMQTTPPKNSKLDDNESVDQPMETTPSPWRRHYQMNALGAALSHYFSPKKRSPGRSPGRGLAQRKLQLGSSDSEGEREEEEEENIKPKKSKKLDNSNPCDFAAVKCCFDELDNHLPSQVESRPNGRTIGQHFEEWLRLLESGEFNILLHGLGSKRLILKQFGDFLTSRAHRIFVVDGLNPSDTVPKIIERMAEELKLKGVAKVKRKSVETAAETLRECIDKQLAGPLVLIVLNIDSPQLRSRVHQTAFSVLANARNVQLIASVDHVNAALIWDQPLRDAFAWLHYPISTYRCYENEVMADGTRLLGLDVRGNAKHTMSSLDVFWEATTSNMRKILTQLALHAPSKEKRGRMNSLDIPKFCRILKDEFATTSETALRQQLIEFCDHRLVQVHKDGNIQLLVDRQLLNAFLVLKNGE